MNIASTSSGSAMPAASAGTDFSVKIAQVQKQIVAVVRQISEEQQSSDDAKTKQQIVAAYQAQLAALQAELMQLMQQAQSRTMEQSAAKSRPTPEPATTIVPGTNANGLHLEEWA